MKKTKIGIAILALSLISGTTTVSAADISTMAVSAGSVSLIKKEYKSLQEAATEIRSKMLGRQREISVKAKIESGDANAELNEILKNVYAEDLSNPCAGDYLKQSILQSEISYEVVQMPGDSALYCTFRFLCTYSDNQSQENYVSAQVKKIVSGLKLTGKGDAEKIKAVYDYMTKNIDYDYSDSKISHSAYGALANKKAVCQGYSTLIYRLLRECGVQNRIITGRSENQNHAWNIVAINGKWYNLDVTWDSSFNGDDSKYLYFLRGTSDFMGHTRDVEFLTAEFLSRYPVSSTSYARYQPAVTKVTGVKASKVTASYVTLTWNVQKKAQYYYVCHLVNGKYKTSSKWKTTGNTLKITTDYSGNKLKQGQKYTYAIVAYNKSTGNTVISTPVTVTIPKVTKPARTSISDTAVSKNKITVSWKQVSSCSGYQIQYSTSSKFTSPTTGTLSVSGKNTTKATLKSLKSGKKYYIRVRAKKKSAGVTAYAPWSSVKAVRCK